MSMMEGMYDQIAGDGILRQKNKSSMAYNNVTSGKISLSMGGEDDARVSDHSIKYPSGLNSKDGSDDEVQEEPQ